LWPLLPSPRWPWALAAGLSTGVSLYWLRKRGRSKKSNSI